MNYAVIADNGGSDQRYRDVVGEVYTFPTMYANILTEGTKFVYQRCSVSSMRVPEPDNERLLNESHYFGTAEIGPVKDLGDGLLEAEIINYKHFTNGVPFRLSDGSHFEVLPGYFWRNGVRHSQIEVYDEISKAGFGTIPQTSPNAGIAPIERPRIPVPTENRRRVARNRSSVQVRDFVEGVGVCSAPFCNDLLHVVINKDGYWLHSYVTEKYYRIAHLSELRHDQGVIKILRGLASKDPIVYDDSKVAMFHSAGNVSIRIGTLTVNEDCIEFRAEASEKTMDIVRISFAMSV